MSETKVEAHTVHTSRWFLPLRCVDFKAANLVPCNIADVPGSLLPHSRVPLSRVLPVTGKTVTIPRAMAPGGKGAVAQDAKPAAAWSIFKPVTVRGWPLPAVSSTAGPCVADQRCSAANIVPPMAAACLQWQSTRKVQVAHEGKDMQMYFHPEVRTPLPQRLQRLQR